VKVTVIAGGSGSAPLGTSGVVSFDHEMKLSFKFGGVVSRVAVREGQRIRRGEALAEIEPAEIDAQVEQARQMADQATRNLARGERLQAEQVISLEQLQDLRTRASIAAAAQRAADFNRRLAVIRAPADGVVLRRLVEPSELVPAGQPALVVAASGAGVIVKAALADRDMARLRLGDLAQISMDAYPDRQFDGSVAMISGAADIATGLFPIEVRVKAPPTPIASGMIARLRLIPGAANHAPLLHVPLTAIVEADGDRAFVYVLHAGHALRRAVKVAFIDAESVAVSAGVAAGESVITDGALYLADNEAVRVVP
jgi:RND family efflux transporter MFP subunit